MSATSETDLGRFGYTQQLSRRVGSYASFAAGSSFVSILAPAGHDYEMIDLAALWCGERAPERPDPGTDVLLAVVGAHLSGQPLNDQLVRRGARSRSQRGRRRRRTGCISSTDRATD